MIRSFLASMFLAALLTASAHGYGAVHAGRTVVTPAGGVQHYGATATNVPGGAAAHTSSTTASGGTVTHTGNTAATGAYGGAYHESNTRVYSPSTYQGYSAAGRSTAVTTTGVVRYP